MKVGDMVRFKPIYTLAGKRKEGIGILTQVPFGLGTGDSKVIDREYSWLVVLIDGEMTLVNEDELEVISESR